MPTESITKKFIVKDIDVFKRMLEDIEAHPPKWKPNAGSALNRGQVLLKKY